MRLRSVPRRLGASSAMTARATSEASMKAIRIMARDDVQSFRNTDSWYPEAACRAEATLGVAYPVDASEGRPFTRTATATRSPGPAAERYEMTYSRAN